MDAAGNFYGTAYQGGPDNYGTVFELKLGKNKKYTQIVLYGFTGRENRRRIPLTLASPSTRRVISMAPPTRALVKVTLAAFGN
jgi:uncharacterized repeat protein (TIGR03803 family)